jgi:hypothetical protein
MRDARRKLNQHQKNLFSHTKSTIDRVALTRQYAAAKCRSKKIASKADKKS